jgi:hypothetical protein
MWALKVLLGKTYKKVRNILLETGGSGVGVRDEGGVL